MLDQSRNLSHRRRVHRRTGNAINGLCGEDHQPSRRDRLRCMMDGIAGISLLTQVQDDGPHAG
jgi:hypothetical protein